VSRETFCPVTAQGSKDFNLLIWCIRERIVGQDSVILTEDEISNITNNKDSLLKTVYDHLVAMFINNEIIPGHLLNRRKLAKDFGISVAPVLEALVLLESEGLVESIPRKGTIVKPVTEQDFYERLTLREAIDCTAVRRYTGAPIRRHKKELLEFAARMDNTEPYTIQKIKMEMIFHASLINLAGLPLLTKEYLKTVRFGVHYMISQVYQSGSEQHRKHVDMVKMLFTEDPDEAEKIVRDHIWGGRIILEPKSFLRPLPHAESDRGSQYFESGHRVVRHGRGQQ
jgi:DNA-binding GntR family transcriptional regulator